MVKKSIFLLLIIAVISKGQQQVFAQNLQKQVNDVFTSSNKSTPDVQVEAPKTPGKSQPHSITFPTSDEDDKFPPRNQYLNGEQRLPALPPYVEATRPTRMVAATTASNTHRYTDDNLDYIRDFAWSMFQGSKLASAIGNLVLSPIQPQLQLSLLRTAATDLTQEEIAHAIREVNPTITKNLIGHFKVTNSLSTTLGVANAMFTRNNLKLNNSFVQAAHEREVDIVPVNFESPDETKYVINNWVANATNNRIKEFFKPSDGISSDTQVILTSSIYFNGEWKYGFSEVKTETFFTTPKLSKSVRMMKNLVSLRTGLVSLATGFSGQWVELPYRGDEFSMVIIIPTQRHRLDEFIRSMRTNNFNDIIKQLSSSYKKLVHLSMPKFTVSSSFSVVNVLLKMGVVDLFAQTSRLPYVTQTGTPLRVQDILQNGFLSVDEKGTIAAVATISHVVTLSLNSAPEEIFFNVDQPFLSIIVDKRNKIPVFISKIFDP